jgi:GTP-binding protein
VGKSTLFNRLTKSRDAIVADFAGLTRDRHYGDARLGAHEFIVIDTGGFEPDASSGIYKEMAKQTRQAVAEADVVIFVVDAREGLSAQDHDIGNYLRKLSKPTLLVANKAEGMTEGPQLVEFYELGLETFTQCLLPTVKAFEAWWSWRLSPCTWIWMSKRGIKKTRPA